jgi:hypothetical protein
MQMLHDFRVKSIQSVGIDAHVVPWANRAQPALQRQWNGPQDHPSALGLQARNLDRRGSRQIVVDDAMQPKSIDFASYRIDQKILEPHAGVKEFRLVPPDDPWGICHRSFNARNRDGCVGGVRTNVTSRHRRRFATHMASQGTYPTWNPIALKALSVALCSQCELHAIWIDYRLIIPSWRSNPFRAEGARGGH